MGVARRTNCRMATDMRVGSLQGVDEAQRSRPGSFVYVVSESILNILASPLTQDDGLAPHEEKPALPPA